MRKLIIASVTGASLGLVGCASVNVRYAAAPTFDDVEAASKAADKGLTYYTLQKIHVSVEPVDAATPAAADTQDSKALVKKTEQAKQDGANQNSPKPEDAKASEKPLVDKAVGAETTKGTKATKKTGATTSADGKPGKAATGKAGEQTAKSEAANPKEQKPGETKPAEQKPAEPAKPAVQKGEDEIAKPIKVINGKTWGATLTVAPDPGHAFLMGGRNGFWKKTTVTGARLANTDQVTTVSIKAENLTAKRLGQIATVLGYFIKTPASAAAVAASSNGDDGQEALLPFEFDVTANSFTTDPPAVAKYAFVPGTTKWAWTLRGAANLPGTVSFDKFFSKAASVKEGVNYFPVPACLTADLVISKVESNGGAPTFTDVARFPLVVATAERVRLEPLPLDGKLTLSKICSATVEGATQVDRYDEAFDNLAALQEQYEKLKKGKDDKKAGAGGTGDDKDGAGDSK